MKITFLGTGGGRFSTISQRRMTGGFRIDNLNGKNLHVDPGPGALVRTYQFGLNPRNLDGIFVSHAHTDHYTDSEILIEAMTRGMTKNKGTIIGSESVLDGYGEFGPCISNYHKSKSNLICLEDSSKRSFSNSAIKGTKTIHGDPKGIGFFVDTGNIKIGYTSDTQYFDGLQEYHEGADILIASVLRPYDQTIRGHMCTKDFEKLVSQVNPKLAIMTHFGLKMINANPVDEAKKITNETGVKTLAAYDGMNVHVNFKDPSYSKISRSTEDGSRSSKRKKKKHYQSTLK